MIINVSFVNRLDISHLKGEKTRIIMQAHGYLIRHSELKSGITFGKQPLFGLEQEKIFDFFQ